MRSKLMNTDNTFFKYTTGVALSTALLLLVPLVAMQFTDEVVWTLGDFVFAGVLLFGTGMLLVLVATKSTGSSHKWGMGIAILSIFLLTWVNLAVGLVGHEGEPINTLYFIIPAVGFIGAFLSRFKSQGLCYTLCIMAVIPMIIAVIALMGYMQEPPHNSTTQILGVNMFFTVLFSLSAISFGNAVKDQNGAELASE